MKTLVRIVALVAAVSLVGAACGDSGEAEQADETQATSGDDVDETQAPSGGDETAPSLTVPSDIPFADDDCLAAVQLLAGPGLLAAALAGQSDVGLAEAEQFFAQAQEAAPDELQDAITTAQEAITAFFQAIQELGIDFSDPASLANADSATLAQLNELAAAFDSEEVTGAFAELEDYIDEQCDGLGG